MTRRVTIAVFLVVGGLAACSPPPDPSISFTAAGEQAADASQDSVVRAGGRVLDLESSRFLLATTGQQPFLSAMGATPNDRVEVDEAGRVCLAGQPETSCRAVVADGTNYRFFDQEGVLRGTLAPSPG